MEDTKNIIKKAIGCHKARDFYNAEILYLDFLAKNPLEAKAFHLLGAMYMQAKNYPKASSTLKKAFELENSIPIQTDLALSYYELKDYSSAFFHLKNVLKADNNKFLVEKILECAQKLDLKSDILNYSIMLFNFKTDKFTLENIFELRDIAALAQDLSEFTTAEYYLKKIIEICPNDAIACNNLGLVYEFMSDFQNAEKYYEKSMKLNPSKEAAYNLSVLLKRKRKYPESLEMLKVAENLGYDKEKCSYNLGVTKLIQRDFSGYKEYSHYLREKQKDILTIWWDGKTKDKNATLVICATDGFGDVLMFSRYLDFINPDDFKEAILIVPKNLYELFSFNFPGFRVIEMGVSLSYTFGTTLIDLPFTLSLDFDHIPSSEKYLLASPDYSKKWQKKFAEIESQKQLQGNKTSKIKIGLFFSGNKADKRTLYNRNLPLDILKNLANIEGAEFYSLQPENTFKETLKNLDIVDLSGEISNFSDTAAIIENLDLVISIDSSVLHLSGALGKKTLLMLPYSGDWRWFADTKNTPWYDSVEIIRQETEGDWNPVAERVIARIQTEIQNKG